MDNFPLLGSTRDANASLDEIRKQWQELYKQFAGDDTVVTEMFGNGNS